MVWLFQIMLSSILILVKLKLKTYLFLIMCYIINALSTVQ